MLDEPRLLSDPLHDRAERSVGAHADVARNHPDERRCDLTAPVIGYRGSAPVRMPELLVRSTLAHLDEAEADQNSDDDARTQWWDPPRRSGNLERLRADERGLKRWFAALPK